MKIAVGTAGDIERPEMQTAQDVDGRPGRQQHALY